MKKIQYTIPPTANVGNCTIVGVSSLTETARENALWEYNSIRAHDGLPPVGTFPNGTKGKVLFFDRAPIPAKKITVHVRGGVAYCDSPAVRIIDHDNR